MKKLLLLVVSLVMTVLLLYSQDYLLLYKQNQQNPKAIPINEIKSISHGDSNIQTIVTNSGEIETPISEIDSLVFSSIHLCPDDKHPHIINLGLPSGTLWSCCNVGASSPEAYGGYYSWGETEEKDVYNEVTYKYSTGVDTDGDGWYDDYHSEDDVYGIWQDLGDNIAGSQYDVAHVKWEDSWRMPNYYEIEELVNNCTYVWVTVKGINGGLFTSKTNGKSIFMPAAGYRWDESFEEVGSEGWYWSSTQHQDRVYAASPLFLDNSIATYWGWCDRGCGNSVRPVYDPWFFTPFSLSEDTVDVFVNSTASVVIETGRGMHELQNENTDIIEAELILADKEKYPDGKDEILIYGIAEGSAKLMVLNKRNNQTATLVVNVKTPTDNDVAITKVYLQSVREFISQQKEMVVEDFQNMVFSWLNGQNWVKNTVVSPDKGLITITFENSVNFVIAFQDLSFFDEPEEIQNATFNLQTNVKAEKDLYYDVSQQTGEEIIEESKIIYFNCLDNYWFDLDEWDGILNEKESSPLSVEIIKEDYAPDMFIRDDYSDYGVVVISNTHGAGNGSFLVGVDKKIDDYILYGSGLLYGYEIYQGLHYINETLPKDVKIIYPSQLKYNMRNTTSITYGNYCWSFDLKKALNDKVVIGYDALSKYSKNKKYGQLYLHGLLHGKDHAESVNTLKQYKWRHWETRDEELGLWPYEIETNTLTNKQDHRRYFSISTDSHIICSDAGCPIIKGQINGYKNLKSGILYYAYVYSKDKELNYADITTKGKLINYEANDGKGINEDGTFSFEYSDLPVDQTSEYKVVVGFNYDGITYYGPIQDLIFGLCPDDKHPHAIDLGLPSGTKWACCNVDTKHPGNQRPANYGGYYAWGETKEKDYYLLNNYAYYDRDRDELIHIGDDIAGTQYDVAHVKWGDKWTMPSFDQILELMDNCTHKWKQHNGINGIYVTGSNGGSIFFPASGYIWENPHWLDQTGFYWSSTINWQSTSTQTNDHEGAFYFNFGSDDWYWANGTWRGSGFTIRPVCP